MKKTITAYFLDQIYSTSLAPHITSPTCITLHSWTLSDNFFSTDISENAISGNFATSISDDLAQFVFLPIDQFKRNHNQHNLRHFHQQTFLDDIQDRNWNNVLELGKIDVDNPFNKFFLMFEKLLETYSPIQKLTKAELKLKSKLWRTTRIMTSIKKKNVIYKTFIKVKNLKTN